MRRIAALVTIVFLAAGAAAYAQSVEGDVYRFELSVEKGKASVLSGPDIKGISNGSARFGFSPTRNFQLTLTYTKWEGEIASDDILGERFALQYNKQFSQADQRVFREARLDQRDFEMKIYEVGIVKTIPMAKHWECFIGIQIGFTDATADVTWTGVETRTGEPLEGADAPAFSTEDTSAFTTSVRGGIRYAPVGWFALQASARISPIGSVFEEDINTLEVNGGLVFRFGKFK